jgi:alpha-aminoadipate/glutamate carrier protein LysW
VSEVERHRAGDDTAEACEAISEIAVAFPDKYRITVVIWEDFPVIKCPECDAAIDVDEDELDEGDALSCDECGADLKVVGVDPLEIESAEDLDEDEEEEDDEDFLDEEESDEEEDEWK